MVMAIHCLIDYREFVQKNYRNFKQHNPTLPIYIRPCDGVEPHVAARYERGMYEVRRTSGMSADKVLQTVSQLEGLAATVNARPGFKGFGGKPKIAETAQ